MECTKKQVKFTQVLYLHTILRYFHFPLFYVSTPLHFGSNHFKNDFIVDQTKKKKIPHTDNKKNALYQIQ